MANYVCKVWRYFIRQDILYHIYSKKKWTKICFTESWQVGECIFTLVSYVCKTPMMFFPEEWFLYRKKTKNFLFLLTTNLIWFIKSVQLNILYFQWMHWTWNQFQSTFLFNIVFTLQMHSKSESFIKICSTVNLIKIPVYF